MSEHPIPKDLKMEYERNKMLAKTSLNSQPGSVVRLIERIARLEAEVHTRTPPPELPEDLKPLVEEFIWQPPSAVRALVERIWYLEAKNKSLGTWNKEQGEALQECRENSKKLNRRIGALEKAVNDHEGKNAWGKWWKAISRCWAEDRDKIKNLESLLSIRDNEVKMLKMELESLKKLIEEQEREIERLRPHVYQPHPGIGYCEVCLSDDRNDGKHLEEKR